MGNVESRTEVLFENQTRSESEKAARAQRVQRETEAEEEFRSIEDRIFREGHRRGIEEALARVEGEVTRQAEAAIVKALLDEEKRGEDIINAEAERLSKTLYRTTIRPTECQKEELALLACNPPVFVSTLTDSKSLQKMDESTSASKGVESVGCEHLLAAYESCVEKVAIKLLHPNTKTGSNKELK